MHMKPGSETPAVRDFLDRLAASSRYSFSTGEALTELGISQTAWYMALSRLTRQERIASPTRGFHVIVPPEYRALACLPADQFIPDLMKRLKLRYYAGLLTAAQYHGAAHQRPMEFQVVVQKPRRPIVCGGVRVAFIVRKNVSRVPVQTLNTLRGSIVVSTPEVTAIDLVGYPRHAGGFSQVTTVLAELAERIDPKKLARAADRAPVPWLQRLGYVLDHVGAADKTLALSAFVRKHAHEPVPLVPGARYRKSSRDSQWRVYVNAKVEADL
jgi:predicted transcriptional regulator of viral defense system